MKLYNIATDKIENKKTIPTQDGTLYPDKLSDEQLNNYGYYKVKYESAPNRRYYTEKKSKEIIGTEYVIGYIVTEKKPQEIKEKMINQLVSLAKEKLEKETSKYSNAEMAGWETLEQEAETFLLDGKINKTKMLQAEADACGQDYAELANEIILNATRLRQLRTHAVSNRYNKKKEIEALTTIDECILYEKEPYEHIVTQEDIDEDIEGTLVLGEAITRYKNNVTDW